MNQLYFGDNLDILRDHIPTASVDLIYLDPPFNSKRSYNVYLNTPKGHQSDAQITAFEDTWHWNEQTDIEYNQILRQPNTDVADLITSFRRFLHESDIMAYLVMMTSRLLELHRVLKPTGSLYLHCDPTASHYLKIVLDNVFGLTNFQNEIIWHYRRWTGSANRFLGMHDVIFFYSKSSNHTFNDQFTSYTEKSLKRKQHHHTRIKGDDVYVTNIDERGVKENDVWIIPVINSQAKERLGYPTQKPIALLERIISASSKPGDVVLDPFCGCGTAVHAAQKLGRAWIGIDITHLAVNLIERRLKDAFPNIKAGKDYSVFGIPEDFEAAQDLARRDKYEFQFWACSLVNAQPYKGGKKGADTGIDGIIYFQDSANKTQKIIVSVKGGETVTRTYISDLKNTVDRENAAMGFFISLVNPTKPMQQEASAAGLYTNPHDEQYPKIQILTIEDLLAGISPKYRDYTRGGATFKKAKTEKEETNQPKLME